MNDDDTKHKIAYSNSQGPTQHRALNAARAPWQAGIEERHCALRSQVTAFGTVLLLPSACAFAAT